MRAVIAIALLVAIALMVWRCRGEVGVEERGAVTTGGKPKRIDPRAPRAPNLTVRVVGAGQPLARVAVAVRPQHQSVVASWDEEATTQLAATDESGNSAFALLRGRYTVAVSARGFLPNAATAIVGSTAVAIEISLDPGGIVLTGVVTDVGGGPIANARIDATRRSGATAFGTVSALTDATGRYELSLARGTYDVKANHDDYLARSEYIEVRDHTEQDFQLVPGGSIRGRVVNDTDTPVAGARVEVPRGSSAVTDENGVFELRGLGAGINRLNVSARRFRSLNPTEVPVALGEHVEGVTLVVASAFVISGRTMAGGVPVADAVVGANGLDRYTTHSKARSDGDGVFELTVAAGPYALKVDDNTVSARMPLYEEMRIDVVDRDVTGIVVELEPGHRVTGRVEPPMAISILPCGGFRVESDAKTGAFAFDHLRAGSCTLRAEADGWSGAVTFANPTTTSVVLPLTRSGTISGRVVTADGKPVDGWVRARVQGGDQYVGRPEDVFTSREGSFHLHLADPGLYRVTASDSDRKAEVSLDVRFDGNDVAGVVLTLPARAELLRGTVVDASGTPVADARVEAFREYDPNAAEEHQRYSRSMSKALTAQDGRFTLEHLRDARYRIVATASNGTARGELTGVALGTTPRIALQPLGTLEARVTLDGAPLWPYRIRCNSDWRVSTSRDGSYRFVHLPPGSYECEADSAEGSVKRTVEIATGVIKLELALERRGAISGTFVDIVTGAPVPGVFVFAIEPQILDRARAGRIQPTDAAGRFLVPAAAGTRELMADSMHGNQYLFERSVTVEPGQTVELGILEGIPPGTIGSIGVGGSFESDGVRITRVDAGEPGDRAGVRIGDVITAINGRPVARLRDVWWQAFGAGRTYRLTLARGAIVSVSAVAP